MSTTAAATTDRFVAIERDGDTAVITLDRPQQRNALALDGMRELTRALETCGADSDIHSIILQANGPAFSAGHNLRELIGRTQDEEREIFNVCTRLMNTIQEIGQPVIAAVHGAAAAAGCQLAASCDLVVAASDASFCTPGVRIGLFCSTPMVALSRNIGRKRAMEMLLTGEPIAAETAAQWGLVNRIVPVADLYREAKALADQIGRFSPLTLAIGKSAFYKQDDKSQNEAYELMGETMAVNAMTCDAQEGMTAFVEKREPTWRGV
jgi:enoyl-CoA hydratase/carnithine racemase